MKKALQTLRPDVCRYCHFTAVGISEADAKRDGWSWESRPKACTCSQVVRIMAIPHQHTPYEVHFKLSAKQLRRLVPGTTYRWGNYNARVIASTSAHCGPNE